MTKLLVIPSDMKDIKELSDLKINGFIVGLSQYSNFVDLQLTIPKLKIITKELKQKEKEIFVVINKVIYNEDIPLLREYLLILDDLKIDGILYEDIGIIKICQDLNIKTSLGWMNSHLLTNHQTCNYWYNRGVAYGFLANEITLNEMLEIKQNTNIKTMVNVFGYLPVAQSSRHLITNYLAFIKTKNSKKIYNIFEAEKNTFFPIYEDKKGTYILSSHILNAIDVMPKLIKNKVDYVCLNSVMIKKDNFIKICECFIESFNNINKPLIIKKLEAKVNEWSDNKTNKGFLYNETIYRVKTNE